MDMLTTMMASMLALAGYEYVGQKMDEQKYPPIGRMVDVGGYKLHAIDRGEGKPVVVVDPGMGCNSLSWGLVYPEIAKFTRVVVIDRAGYAWSDASPLPRTSENAVSELHALLKNGNIPGPYILVGHSFGGANVRLFASKYPDEVAGVVLVDSSHEDSYKEGSIFNKESAIQKNFITRWKEYLEYRKDLFEDYLGLHDLMTAEKMQEYQEKVKLYPEEVKYNYGAARRSIQYCQAKAAEYSNFKLSLKQLKDDGGLLGDKPLTVIMAGKKPTIEECGGRFTQEEIDKHTDIFWPELQADLAAKSSRGKLIIAENSHHGVPEAQPEIIIQAVSEMVDELRNT